MKLKPVKEIRDDGNVVLDYYEGPEGRGRLERYVKFILNELDVKDIKIALTPTKIPVQALVTIDPLGQYVLCINKKFVDHIYIAIAHEVTHIKQHELGEWDLAMPTTKVKVNDPSNYEYVSEEAAKIEAEARMLQGVLYRAYKRNERWIRINKRRKRRAERRSK